MESDTIEDLHTRVAILEKRLARHRAVLVVLGLSVLSGLVLNTDASDVVNHPGLAGDSIS